MPNQPQTNELMKLLPPALRPNPYNLDESVMDLLSKGWSTADIFAGIMADKPKEPGHVVGNIRKLQNDPPPPNPYNTPTNTTGPCQLGCDFGWFGTRPCESCKPDTLRRLKLRNQARNRGAGLDELNRLMTQDARHTTHTYPIEANGPAVPMPNHHPLTTTPPQPGQAA